MIRALKNKWVGISDEGLYEAVQDCLTLGARLQTSQFTVEDVRIQPDMDYIAAEDASECYIHTLCIDQAQDEKIDQNRKQRRRLLIIVGYAGTGVSFFPMFEGLREEFEITTVDILGFGCSGRPTFRANTVAGVLGWFSWQLRAWMEATGYDAPGKGAYSMFCHSMGCYFASHWAIDNHAKIDQLFFMSPSGLEGPPDNFSPSVWINQHDSLVKRTLFKIANSAWGRHYSPATVFKLPGYYGALALHKGWMQRIKNKDDTSRACFSKLLMQSCLRRTSFDTCMDSVIAFGGFSNNPMSGWYKARPELQTLRITWLFGEEDFFDRGPADQLIVEGTLKNSKVFEIPNAGHHPYIDNPSASTLLITSNILSST